MARRANSAIASAGAVHRYEGVLTPPHPRRSPDQAAQFVDAGAQLACVLMPRPYDPRVLERVATHLEPLDIS